MSSLPTVLLTNSIAAGVLDSFAGKARFVIAPDTRSSTLCACAAEADGIIVRAPLPHDIFQKAPRLAAAVRHGTGIDMIPIEAANEAGVPVANVPGMNARAVAEFGLMQMISLARNHKAIRIGLEQRDWSSARTEADSGFELLGRTLGIVGVGHIGTELAKIARAAFEMKILGSGAAKPSWPPYIVGVPLASLLSAADFVVLSLPLKPETRGIINAAALAQMKASAYLINLARGAIVDETALLNAVTIGQIAGAALDVFETQPLPRQHPFFGLPNVIVTPHVAGITADSMWKMGQHAIQQALDILAGIRPKNLINPEAWEARRKPAFVQA